MAALIDQVFFLAPLASSFSAPCGRISAILGRAVRYVSKTGSSCSQIGPVFTFDRLEFSSSHVECWVSRWERGRTKLDERHNTVSNM